jgi:phosphoglycerate dehydrogenase-like enzyme
MSSGVSIVTDFPFDEADRQIVRAAAGPENRVEFTRDAATLRLALSHADALCTFHLPADVLALAPRLRWLQYPGAGIDSLVEQGFDLGSLPFAITTASSANAVATAEYILGLLLIFARKWDEMMRLQGRREWAMGHEWGALRGFELQGKTVGIIGLGATGRRVAQMCRALSMRVLGLRRTSHAGEADPDCDQMFDPDHLTDLLGESDFAVLCVPLTSATTRLIGIHELRAMHPNAYLINVARGAVVDEAALIRALRERWIAGAGLDVVAEEPLARANPLWSLPGVVITPHLSAMTVGYSHRVAALFAANIERFCNGQPLLHHVDPERGY